MISKIFANLDVVCQRIGAAGVANHKLRVVFRVKQPGKLEKISNSGSVCWLDCVRKIIHETTIPNHLKLKPVLERPVRDFQGRGFLSKWISKQGDF